jgi:hypothetical protein
MLTIVKQSTSPGAGSANDLRVYSSNSAVPYLLTQDENGVVNHVSGTNASSVAAASGFATDTYLAGSGQTIFTAGLWKASTSYYCGFDMVKTAAGTAAFTVNVRMGTLGTTGDASVLQLAFAVGTAAIDSGWFELFLNFRSVGAGTSAVVAGMIHCSHALAATGLITTGASGHGQIAGTGAGFNSTTQTKIGISVNGGASFAGTNTIVQSGLRGI